MQASQLDDAVARAVKSSERSVALRPVALYLLSTGVDVLSGRLERGGRVPLERIEGVPASWAHALLHFGWLRGLPVWLIENAPVEPAISEPAWAGAFPVWWAAAMGASTLVTCCAGSSLDNASAPAGTIALVRDHINLSGSTPLLGVGASELGAQFPDQSRVHETELIRAAKQAAERLGLNARECIAACTLGPTLETPAEQRWMARAGAHVSAQGMALPLIAAAHAGLGGLALVVVVQEAEAALDIAKIAARSEALAPALDDLLTELALDVQRVARARLDEVGR
ncbi:MAG: hypothetical protein IT454_13440 [Planctomycetes bacterium]|nr:hypothetical protein [Planctomycetota bacterium]